MLHKINRYAFCCTDLLLLLLYIEPIATLQPKLAIFTTADERCFDPFTSQGNKGLVRSVSRDRTLLRARKPQLLLSPISACWSDLDKKVEPN